MYIFQNNLNFQQPVFFIISVTRPLWTEPVYDFNKMFANLLKSAISSPTVLEKDFFN